MERKLKVYYVSLDATAEDKSLGCLLGLLGDLLVRSQQVVELFSNVLGLCWPHPLRLSLPVWDSGLMGSFTNTEAWSCASP